MPLGRSGGDEVVARSESIAGLLIRCPQCLEEEEKERRAYKMNSMLKLSKQTVPPVVVERRKRDREKERMRLTSKRKIPPDAKSRFGKDFFAKFFELFQSDDQDSYGRMREMHEDLISYYKEHDISVMWLSDDETDNRETKAPLSKKMHQDIGKGDVRCISANRSKIENKEKVKLKPDIRNPSVINTTSSSLLSQFEISDDSDDNISRKSSASHTKSYRLCDTCSGATSVPNNMILECEECGKTVHQKCARPEITPLQAKDPRFLFVCTDCKDREEEKMGLNSSKSHPSNNRKDEKGSTQKFAEERIQPLKAENDILITFSNFAAKKAKKSVSSINVSGLQGSNSVMNKIIPSFGFKDRK